MRTSPSAVLAGLAVCATVLAACGPREDAATPTEAPAEGSVTEPLDAQPAPEVPAAPAAKEDSFYWNTYHGSASLDGVADVRLPDELSPHWRFTAGAPVSTTPVAGGDNIYFVNTKGRLFAVDVQGNEVWAKTISREAIDRWSPTEERFDAPLVFFGGTLFAGSVEGLLLALDAASGEVRWQADLGGTILGSPNVAYDAPGATDADSGRVFVIEQGAGVLHCFDFRTGKPIWRAEGVGRCDGSSGVGGDTVVFGSCASALHVFSAKDGGLLREIAIGDELQVAGGVVVQDDWAFSGTRGGNVLRANIKTGDLVWTNADCTDDVLTTPAVNETHVVFGSADGKVYALDRTNGELKWSAQVDGEVTSPVIAADKVVATSGGVLVLLRLADGQQLWSYPVSDAITSPAVFADMVVVGCDDGTVAAFR